MSTSGMPGSRAATFILSGGAVASILGGLAITWSFSQPGFVVDPRVERACHDEVEMRSPLGHRKIISYGYVEDGPKLGIVRGGHEAQYAPGKWTAVLWTCRINPGSRRIFQVELQQTRGGQRMKAAASSF